MSDAIEAIVLRTSETETKANGLTRTVTFLLPNDGPHPFVGMVGQTLAIACARIDTAVAARPADGGAPHASVKGGDKPRPKFHGMPRSQQAALKCRDPQFGAFLGMDSLGVDDPTAIDELLKEQLHIASKRELDTDPDAAKRWDALLAQFEADTGRMAERR